MADIFTKKQRSALMSKIRSKRTKPEMTLHAHLKAAKMRHQMWPNWLTGHPDIVIGLKTVVFVHGCFWHGCPAHYRAPKSNRWFWRKKVQGNRERHWESARRLRRLGWKVVVIWEHDLRTLQATRKVVNKLKQS